MHVLSECEPLENTLELFEKEKNTFNECKQRNNPVQKENENITRFFYKKYFYKKMSFKNQKP